MDILLENIIKETVDINVDSDNAALTVSNTGSAASFTTSGDSPTVTILNTGSDNAALTVSNTGLAASFTTSSDLPTVTILNTGSGLALATGGAIEVGSISSQGSISCDGGISSTGTLSGQTLALADIQVGADELQTLKALHAGQLKINLTSEYGCQLYDSEAKRNNHPNKEGYYALTSFSPSDMSNYSSNEWRVAITSNQLTTQAVPLLAKNNISSSQDIDMQALLLKIDALTKTNDELLNRVSLLENKHL